MNLRKLLPLLLAATLLILLPLSAHAAPQPYNPANRATNISGYQWTCTYTKPTEYMIHSGGTFMQVTPGLRSFTAYHVGTGWESPYISEGYDQSLNAGLCNGRTTEYGHGYGKAFAIPARLGRQGHPVGSAHDWTSRHFRGDPGYDLWLTANPWNSTYKEMTNQGSGTTEIMIWLSHPGLRSPHRYNVRIDHRRWGVTYGLAVNGHGRSHGRLGWNVVNFIAPNTRTGDVSVGHLALNPFMSYAIRHGFLLEHAYLMAVDQGAEFTRGQARVVGYTLTGLPR